MRTFPLALLVVIAASGCGAHPTTPKTPRASNAAVAPVPLTEEPVAPGQAVEGRAIADRLAASITALPAYKLQMKWWQKAGARTSKGTYQIAGKAPRTTFIDITDGASKGTKLLFSGGSTVKVRPAGLLGAITVNLDVNDDRMLSVRGYNIPQTDLRALMEMVSDPRGTVGLQRKAGAVAELGITGPQLLPGCTKLRLVVDTANNVPTRMELSDAREIVFTLDISDFKPMKDVSLAI